MLGTCGIDKCSLPCRFQTRTQLSAQTYFAALGLEPRFGSRFGREPEPYGDPEGPLRGASLRDGPFLFSHNCPHLTSKGGEDNARCEHCSSVRLARRDRDRRSNWEMACPKVPQLPADHGLGRHQVGPAAPGAWRGGSERSVKTILGFYLAGGEPSGKGTRGRVERCAVASWVGPGVEGSLVPSTVSD